MVASTQTEHAIFHQGNQSRIDHVAGSALSSGDIIYTTGMTQVVTSPEGIANGALGSVAIDGIFKVKKDTGVGITHALGAIVEWDVTGETAQATGSGDGPIGIATKASLNGDNFVETWLNKINLPA